MRIAYVCADPGVPVFGCKGCSVHVQEVIRALQHQGHTVTLFTPRLGGAPPADLQTVAVESLPSLPRGDLGGRELAAIAANQTLDQRLRQAGSFDLVYERYSLWSFAAMEYAQAQGIPGVLEVNAPLIEEQALHRGLLRPALAQQVAQRVFTATSLRVAVSGSVADYVRAYTPKTAPVQVVANGVNPDRFPQVERPLHRPDYTVGFVGTMKAWHGLPILGEAFALLRQQVPQARLLLVGDGPMGSHFLQELAGRGLADAVDWRGAVPADQVPPLLQQMDVAVAPYPALDRFYFSPLKVYEYMAAGLPVVASDLGQLWQVIQPGVNGMLSPAGDSEALARHLSRLAMNPEERHHLGAAARQTILSQHTWSHRVQQILRCARASAPATLATPAILTQVS